DDIGTNLSAIALASQSLSRKRGSGTEAREALGRIGAVAQRTTEQMKDIVWVLKTNNDSLDDIIIKMREVAGQLLKGTPITFLAPAAGFAGTVDLEFKRNVFLFYKECLNNVVKHSRATEVTIRVDYGEGKFTMQIDDNGRGFTEEGITPGSGLQNLRARARLMNGEVTIDSKPGHGTHVALVVKMT
ncbi:MAG TPA: ATP-binding protein, partial [Bacteroidota bacterium]|nr:ATP-binding protein [Bacteroidota bacterium]